MPPMGTSSLSITRHHIRYLQEAVKCFFINLLKGRRMAVTTAIETEIPANVNKKSVKKAVILKKSVVVFSVLLYLSAFGIKHFGQSEDILVGKLVCFNKRCHHRMDRAAYFLGKC